jgi:ribosome-binding factor A
MAQGYRPDRVGDQIRQELSEILTRGDVHDPGIGFITLTRVQVTADLQLARVFYTSLGDPKARKETARALTRATGFFRRRIGARLQLRRVPELEFRFDESIAHQDRIEQILRDIHEEDAQRASRPDGGPESESSPLDSTPSPHDSAPSISDSDHGSRIPHPPTPHNDDSD